MVICDATMCQYNKETFCTKENTVIRMVANGFPVCDIMALNHTIINNEFNRKQNIKLGLTKFCSCDMIVSR